MHVHAQGSAGDRAVAATGQLSGRVAVVTGAGSGIGRAIATRLAAAGARVCAADLVAASAQETAAGIEAVGGSAFAFGADVSSEADVAAMVAAAVERNGRLDVLVNNAAATGEVIARDQDLLSLDVEVWDATMAVNVRGPMLGCKHAIPHMLAGGGGSIVNLSSIAGFAATDRRAAYGTSKAALVGFARYVAAMYGKRGVRCNNVAPSLVLTPSSRNNLTAERRERSRAHHLTPDNPSPEGIADAVAFLASDASRFVTGQTLLVDGGFLSHQPQWTPGADDN